MRRKLIFVFLFVFNCVYSQSFTLESIQTNEQVEIALDSAYVWMESADLENFTKNYFVISQAVEISGNEEFKARLSAFKASFYCYLYDNSKFKDFLDSSLNYYQQHHDTEMLVYVYNLKGIYESYVNIDYRASIIWHKKAVELVKPGDITSEKMAVDGYFNLAVSCANVEDWDGTYEASSKCIELAKKYSKGRLRRMFYHKGLALLNKNDIAGAIENFKLSENLVKEAELARGAKVYYKDASYLFGFSEVYRVLGESDKSATYLREYNSRISASVHSFSKNVGLRIQKHSGLLVDLAKRKQEKAQVELEKSEFLYNILLIGLALLIIGGLLFFIFQQRKHEKLNVKKNDLLRSKNSELITVKEEVESALKVKTDFLNSITHELRTPLYAINSITHMIKENENEKIDSSQIDILSFSGDHLLRFINDVIDFNLGANNFEFQDLKLECINLESLLFKIKKTIKFSLDLNNQNNFVFDFDPAISQDLLIDTLKLSRIIINLLNNASKYTNSGSISLVVKQLLLDSTTSTVSFAIQDTGKGISSKQLNEINIAFDNNLDLIKRIDNKASGLGIGLVMVNRLLRLYDSELIIESEEGIGTTMGFHIIFDIAPHKNNTAALNMLKPTLKQKHILIVDDNKVNQLVTSKIVKELGHTCNVASGGQEAITMYKEKVKYDVVLMDIMMPVMDGYEAAEIIKTINPEQRIIALTAISLRENKQKFIDSGFEDIIEKPFEMGKFKSIIA